MKLTEQIINKNQEEFIQKAKDIHGDKYDYSLVVYKTSKIKVKIICPTHGIFEQCPQSHILQKAGCPKCSYSDRNKSRRITQEEYIKRVKDIHREIDLSRVIFKDSYTKVILGCHKVDKIGIEHGWYEQFPHTTFDGHGCPKCGLERRAKSHERNYIDILELCRIEHPEDDHSLIKDRVNSDEKITPICKKHGTYEVILNDYINKGCGCPKCNLNNTSKQEKEILEIAKKYYTEVESNTRSIISPKEIDIYIPSIKLGIEFNGLYWHTEDRIGKDAHLNKTTMSEEKGIHLIQIFGDEWTYKRDIVESRLLNIFHKTPKKIYARKCDIREVDRSIGKKFLKTNHLQGYSSYEIGLGLYFEDKLVSLMTFGKRRVCLGKKSSEEGDIELIRFASILNCNVIGSAERLFKNYVRTYNPKKITSYADRFWTMKDSNNVYEKLGFKFDGVTAPNYFYVINGVRKHRYGFRKGILVKEGYDPKMSEREIMEMRGIKKIFNSGNLRYIWNA